MSLLQSSLVFAPTLQIQYAQLVSMRESCEMVTLDYAPYLIDTGRVRKAVDFGDWCGRARDDHIACASERTMQHDHGHVVYQLPVVTIKYLIRSNPRVSYPTECGCPPVLFHMLLQFCLCI
jgi:hypothetical protein